MRALRTRMRSRIQPSRRSPEHRIVVLVRALLLFESAMYSAVTPVLPHYAHMLHASKPAVGVLAAAYPFGIVPGSLLGAWVATRAGVRRTTLIGLCLFSASIIAFGFASDIVSLDVLRVLQGAGCGFIWGGGLTWVIAVAPRHRRGGMLGTVMAAAIFGTLLGPVLGTLAVAIGTEAVFSVVGAVALALAAWTLGHPEPALAREPQTPTPVRAVIRERRILLGGWLIVLEAGTIGAAGTLIPLRLAHFGAPGLLIGGTFLVASLFSTRVSGPIGRLVDRRGPAWPLYAGLSLTAVLMALLPLPQSAILLAIVSVIALGGPLTAYTVPAIAILTEGTERAGIPLAVATMLLNLAWAGGETVGAPAAANLSQATSDAVPLLVLSLLMVLSLRAVASARLQAPARAGAAPAAPERQSAPTEPGAGDPAPAGARPAAETAGYT